MIGLFEIDDNFELTMSDTGWSPSPSISARVDAIWRESIINPGSAGGSPAPKLFDGTVLQVVARSANGLSCRPIPFRFFFAQQQDPDIKAALGIKLAAVCGLTIVGHRVLLGRRSDTVTQNQGQWELAPSGSISYAADGRWADFKSHLLSELTEELGVESTEVQSVQPCLLVCDEEALIYDICCRITLKRNEYEAVLAGFTAGEYSKIQASTLSDLHAEMQRSPATFVPGSIAIVQGLIARANRDGELVTSSIRKAAQE